MNSCSIKNNNRGLVLQLIATGEATSRRDIAARTGLTKMAVSNIVSELIDSGYIVETEEKAAAPEVRGRCPVSLDLSASAPKVISLYIGRQIVEATLTDLKCEAMHTQYLPISNDDESTLERKMTFLLDSAFQRVKERVLGISVSAIGLVDHRARRLATTNEVFGITSYDIANLLESRYGTPVSVNNDMNNAALLENLFGAGKTYHNFVYVGITTGLGMGIVIGGSLYQGARGFAGELAHMSIDTNGNPCHCGNRGCLETYISMPALYKRLMDATGLKYVDFLAFSEVAKIPAAAAVFRDAAEKLTMGLVNIVNILDIEAIIIGHEGAFLPDPFLQELEKDLNERVIFSKHGHVAVQKGSFTDEWIPASAQVVDEVFRGTLY
jgi:predicted NBD/HSP70 family sugar kinase